MWNTKRSQEYLAQDSTDRLGDLHRLPADLLTPQIYPVGPKGAKGDKGDTGAQGRQGPAGKSTNVQPEVYMPPNKKKYYGK